MIATTNVYNRLDVTTGQVAGAWGGQRPGNPEAVTMMPPAPDPGAAQGRHAAPA
jgi:hypothetical protein